jgi:integration host factor subunit beta
MNKPDLIQQLSIKESLTATNASKVIDLVFDGFTDTLKKDGRIEIRGFGSLTIRDHGAYPGRNPKTGEKIPVGPKKMPFFKAGKELKERVNRGL